VAALVSDARAHFGSVDILVNNAGISPKHNGGKLSTVETPLDEWREVMRINLRGPFLLARACVPLMQERGWGRIVSISSLAGRTGSRFPSTSYAASKAGVIGLSRVLAEEVGRDGITVNCVAPGRIVTPMSNESGADVQREYAAKVPVGRLGLPEDIAAAVAFLASDAASNITGATLDVNGGVYTN
jgi:3-oxoacyl-[acyl-carrier protein] reductase